MPTSLTKEQIVKRLLEDGRGIELIGDYVNARVKTTWQCSSGHQWQATYANVQKSNGCPTCANEKKTFTADQIKKRLLEDGRGIELIGDYVNAHAKTKWQCSMGHQWQAVYSSIQRGIGCPTCANEKYYLTSDQIKKRLLEDSRGIELIGDYVNSYSKTTWQCSFGHQWKAVYSHIQQGGGCPTCANQKMTLTADQIKKRLLEDGRGIELIGDYVNSKTKSTWKCSFGHQWKAVYKQIKNGAGCPTCAKTGFKTNKPAYRYILLFNDTPTPFIKYGITNNLKRRLAEHKCNGQFNIVYQYFDEDGNITLKWEKDIKEKYGGQYVSRTECPDGWTETLSPDLLPKLI